VDFGENQLWLLMRSIAATLWKSKTKDYTETLSYTLETLTP
jgi:hypothetical protein